jgi:hypothetical protein
VVLVVVGCNQPTPPPAEPTPTQEVGTPEPEGCLATTLVNLNLRVEANPDAPLIDTIPAGEFVVVLRVRYVGDDEWAEIQRTNGQRGWSASYFAGEEFLAYDPTQGCLDVRFGEPQGSPAVFAHFVVGGSIDALIAGEAYYRRAGIRWGALVVDDPGSCIKVHLAGGICIPRTNVVGDCPDVTLPPAESAVRYFRSQEHYFGTILYVARVPYLAVANECNFDDPVWWSNWLIAAVAEQEARNWPPLVAPQFYAHQPTIEWLELARPGLTALRDARGLLGMHCYSVLEGTSLRYPSPWMPTDRDREVSAWLAENVPGLRIFYSEVAPGPGNWPVDVDDFVWWSLDALERRSLYGFALWTFGRVGTMPVEAVLDGHWEAISRGIASR